MQNKTFRLYRRALLYCIFPFLFVALLTAGVKNKYGAPLKSCTPKKKIAFLKTHKCASSTIQNILFRYGEAHGLNFVLPLKGNYLGRSQHFNRHMIADAPWHHLDYDIFAVHTIWNTTEVRSVIGAEETILISILRDPVEMFESLYYFAQWDTLFHMDIERFAHALDFNTNRSTDFLSVAGYTGHNQMLHDFGLPDHDTLNIDIVKSKIIDIERDFHLIMIAEHMDESLILLQHLLCWDLQDVTSLPVNERKASFRRQLKAETRALLRRWLWADQMLYDYFLSVFYEKKLEFGQELLTSEANKLKKLNSRIKLSCGATEANQNNLELDFRPYSSRVIGFTVRNNGHCEKLARSELAYIEALKVRQFEQLITVSENKTLDIFS